MKEHPILFSAPMVLALLAGRKSVTRRMSRQWLKVKAGDQLWVRENLSFPARSCWEYSADKSPVMVTPENETAMIVWAHHKEHDYCPSIHMPRWASRIQLEALEDARLERLQDMDGAEILREGVTFPGRDGMLTIAPISAVSDEAHLLNAFRALWSTLHTKPGERWEENPELVRVGEFRRLA